ncbi:MAG: tail fiber protein [Pseudomonadota bacterium]
MKYVPPVNGDQDDPDRSYVNENAASGIEGSIPSGAAFEHPIREIVNVITEAGMTPTEDDLTQLTAAIKKIVENAAPEEIAQASTTTSGIVELATNAEVTAGTNTDRAITPASLKQSHRNLVPPGTIIMWAAATAPQGYLPCEGAAISRTTYADLFDVIGTTYGEGNGTTTFNLPDFRGEFARGWDHNRGIDPERTFGSSQNGSHFLFDPHNNEGWLVYANQRLEEMRQVLGFDRALNDVPDWVGLTWVPKKTGRGNLHIYHSQEVWSVARPRNIAMAFCIRY